MKNQSGRGLLFVALCSLVVSAGLWALFAPGVDAQYNVPNYMEQGGARWVIGGSLDVASGGDLDIESTGAIKIAGTTLTPSAAQINKLTTVTATAAELNRTSLPGRGRFNICGDSTTINSDTVYYGPDLTLTANTSGGQACDINAAGSTTEANEDLLVYYNQAVQVVGMTCRQEGDMAADIIYTLRTAAGATAPSVTCTIPDNYVDCVADVQTTTAIAAGATVAIAASSAAAIGANGGFVCEIEVTF